MSDNSLTIYCKCIHRNLVPPESCEIILQNLDQSGAEVVAVDDLCGLAAEQNPVLKEWADKPDLTVIACYDRAIRWLFDMAGAPLALGDNVQILNPRLLSPDDIVNKIRSVGSVKSDGSDQSNKKLNKIKNTGNQEPWFPVIDRGRCRSCKLCFNFCLFGVYTVDDDKSVIVSHPENCKNNCPACARVCPERAVIFPKLDQSPINGAEIDESKTSAAPIRLDLLQEADIYSLLRNRGKQGQRFSPEPRPQGNMLEMLHKQLDIPMEVLQTLSPSDLNRIKTKASRAGEPDEK